MIVRDFLRWANTASVGDRADATAALARAYLHAPLEVADRAAAEAALFTMLDDPAPAVREAMAHAFGSSPRAPRALIHALAHDADEIAAIVLTRSPVLSDAELVDAVAAGDWRAQVAIACRTPLSAGVAGAVAEVGGNEACLALVLNPDAATTVGSLLRIVARHGGDAPIRTALLERSDLPPAVRAAAIDALSTTLAAFATDRGWLGMDKARRVATEARDKATVAVSAWGDESETFGLVQHLASTGQLTASLVLRALLSGNLALFEVSLAYLSGLPHARVSGYVHGRRGAGFEALYRKTGLPPRALPAFRAALAASHELGFTSNRTQDIHLSRRMIERVLTSPDILAADEEGHLLLMLRRFMSEAARDEARAIAGDLVKDILIAA